MFAQNRALTVAGWVIAVLIGLVFTPSGAMKLQKSDELVKGMVEHYGYPERVIRPLGMVELFCLAVFLYPRTATLGAVLLTGYLGGAVATHLRANEPFVMPVIIGVFVWLSLFLRDPRIREVLPVRMTPKLREPPML